MVEITTKNADGKTVKCSGLLYCPQCGLETTEFVEGYCPDCHKENQRELDEHNERYSYWQGLTDKQRDDAIRRAI